MTPFSMWAVAGSGMQGRPGKNNICAWENNSRYDTFVDAEPPAADDIERQVIAAIAKKKKLDPTSVTSATTFEELGLDSLDAADLMFTIEDTFKIVVPDDAALSMRSVGEIIAGVRTLVGQRAQGANAS